MPSCSQSAMAFLLSKRFTLYTPALPSRRNQKPQRSWWGRICRFRPWGRRRGRPLRGSGSGPRGHRPGAPRPGWPVPQVLRPLPLVRQAFRREKPLPPVRRLRPLPWPHPRRMPRRSCGLCIVLLGVLRELDGFDERSGLLVQELVHDDDGSTSSRHSGGSAQNAEDCFHVMTSLAVW